MTCLDGGAEVALVFAHCFKTRLPAKVGDQLPGSAGLATKSARQLSLAQTFPHLQETSAPRANREFVLNVKDVIDSLYDFYLILKTIPALLTGKGAV